MENKQKEIEIKNSKNPKLNKDIEKPPNFVYDIFEKIYTKEGGYQKN